MSKPHLGVAISTTGHEHRMRFLETCVKMWDACLPRGASMFVTVDGTEDDVLRVAQVVHEWTGSIFRVGQRALERCASDLHKGRLGVAANKNTGLELLMDGGKCDQMFLSDDDSWPFHPDALALHTDLRLGHSLVCWGRHRRSTSSGTVANWSWPRGAVMYVEREVVETVGGMVEAFGAGGHEHVEWSRRINQAGLTPCLYPSPMEYTGANWMGASVYWHCEDMPQYRESVARLVHRKNQITSIERPDGYEQHIDSLMSLLDGVTDFVPYRAEDNGRSSATLSAT